MSMLTITDAERSRIKRWQWGILALAVLAEIFLAADWYGFAAVLTFVSESLHLDRGRRVSPKGFSPSPMGSACSSGRRSAAP